MLHGPVSPKFIVSEGLSPLHPGPAVSCSTSLHGSRYIRRGPLSRTRLFAQCLRAGSRSLLSPLGDLARLTRCNLWPPRQLNPHQVGAFVELALPSYQSMILAALFYPPDEVTEPLQLDAGGGMELPFHIGHILEGVIFLNAPPLIQALEKMCKDLVPQLIPFCLLKGAKIGLIIGPEDMFKVLPPPLAPMIGDILQRVFRSLHVTTTLTWCASRC